MAAGFSKLVEHALDAYSRNWKQIAAFSIPFLIALPLSLMLPNFVALSATFLRLGSVKLDLSAFDAVVTIAALLLSLLFFAFATVLINMVVKSQRTLNKLVTRDFEAIESATFSLFFILLTAFAAIVGFNLLSFEYGLDPAWGVLFSLAVSCAVLFAPQAVVLEETKLTHSVGRSIGIIRRKFGFFLAFVALAAVLLLANTWVFLEIGRVVPWARFLSLFTQAFFILPFLEVLKVQIYLSKYAIL